MLSISYTCDHCNRPFEKGVNEAFEVMTSSLGKTYSYQSKHACSAVCRRGIYLREADVSLDDNGELISRLAEADQLRGECDSLRKELSAAEARHRETTQKMLAEIAELRHEAERSASLRLRKKVELAVKEGEDIIVDYAELARKLARRIYRVH